MSEKKKLVVRFEFPDGGVSLVEFGEMLVAMQDAMPSCNVVVSCVGLKKGEKND
jgi:hypothetical protein